MPRFKDACGCYNKEDARELGLVAAIIWYDILNSSELFETNPIWYDQRKAGDRLGIPYQTISRALKNLEEAGRISIKVGYRPNSTIRTTWITILTPDLDEHQKSQNEISKKSQNETSIYKETKEKDTAQGAEFGSDNQGSLESVIVFFRVNPSGRPNGWKSQRVYSIQEEVDRIEGLGGEETVDFKYWKSPKWVGDEEKAKYKRTKVKLIQPDVVEKDEEEYKMINGRKCKRTVYKDAGGNEHEGWVQVDNTGLCY